MNGSATLANGHDASTVVQLQDIQEQQDPIVVADEETALWPNAVSPLDCILSARLPSLRSTAYTYQMASNIRVSYLIFELP